MAKITLKDVSKVYDGSLAAVQDFNLEVEDREFVVLVGPSGCGKSTVLRMIAGLEEVSEGELYIGGRLVNDIPPKDRDVAMVFQNYALYPHMTVYENMGFPLKADGVSKPEMDQRIKESAELLGITELLHRRPNQLSGGERQRVAIGRALVREPAVFLMDEPLSNLDAKLRTELRAEIIKLRRRVDTTFIYVTHDQVEAMTLGDRLVIMRDGRIQQIGAPQHVFLHPANIFVAGFIGTPQMNFFDVKLEEQRGRYSIHLGNAVIELDGEQSSRLSSSGIESRELILGIRPENLTIADKDDGGAVIATVELSELMGGEICVHLTACERECVMSIATDSAALKHGGFQDKDEIAITFSALRAQLFDPKTQENLLPE
ncbi:MAG: sn-glycerol-3-phosphate ABC transporter ATP-binding protein UgpC [Oscillospiraceae bacterium]